MKPSRLTRIGLISLFLPLSLTACGRAELHPQSIPTPPDSLLADCPERVVAIRTNGDLTIKINTLKEDLALCNGDKAALRTWKQQIDGSKPSSLPSGSK